MDLHEAMSIFEITDINDIKEEDIKRVYRKLSCLYHPDAHPNEDNEYYLEEIKKINNAYDILKRH